MGFSDILGAGSALLGAFGGSDETGSPSSSTQNSASGYYALPQQAQSAYNNYFNLINSLGTQGAQGTVNGGYSNYNGSPNSPFYSQGLGSLQAANPGTGVNPSGYLEPFNQYQQSALQGYGNPDYSQQGLSPYMNPYQQNVTNATLGDINHSYDISNSGIMDNNSRLNSRAVGSSLGTQLAQNQENRARDIGDASAALNSAGYNSALDLRNQSLQQQLAAGTAIQGQNQSALALANPSGYLQSQYASNPSYAYANALGSLFGAFPNSSNSSGTNTGSTITPNSYQSSPMSQAGGIGMALFGNGTNGSSGYLSSLFG